LKVEIWSDVVCPWCYVGKRRFEAALERFEHRDEVEVEFHSFELNPQAEADEGTGLDQRLARKYGLDIEKARALNARVAQAADGEGLRFRLDIARPGNTFDAHRLIHLAAAEGRQDAMQNAMKERLLAAYFTEGRAIGDRDTLIELAVEVGIDRERAQRVLESDGYAAEVRADEREASQLGITGVPFFVINRRYGVSGAQPSDLMLQALGQAWDEANPVQVIGGAGPDAADCADGTCAV
jgi:predicted DsbA family dithiol-disulfide isomerase